MFEGGIPERFTAVKQHPRIIGPREFVGSFMLFPGHADSWVNNECALS